MITLILQTTVNAMTTQLPPFKFTLRALISALFILVMSGISFPVAAQFAGDTGTMAETAAIDAELIQMLRSPDEGQRDSAFGRVTDLAYRSSEINLAPLVPILVDIYKNDSDSGYRLAAVSALYAIGDEAGMKQVRKRALQEPSLLVQYVSVSAVLDYFGPTAYGTDAEAVKLARNVLARTDEARRLAQMQQAVPIADHQR